MAADKRIRQRRCYRRTTTDMYPKMLKLYLLGYSYIAIGKVLNCNHSTVGNYIRSVLPPEKRRPPGRRPATPTRSAR